MPDKKSTIPAATVLLLRDGPDSLEVFMVVRRREIDTFSGALVFPGGKVDGADSKPELRRYCRDNTDLSDETLAFRIAAIREAFEECGILLARVQGEHELISAERMAGFADTWRRRLLNLEADMLALCQAEGLQLACDILTPFAHWITPEHLPKRFDTQFFLAPTPVDHIAAHDTSESSDSLWITPDSALADASNGRRTLVFVTRMNLRRLGRSATVADAVTAANSATIMPIQPRIEPHEQGRVLCIPAAAGYGASRILMDKHGVNMTILE